MRSARHLVRRVLALYPYIWDYGGEASAHHHYRREGVAFTLVLSPDLEVRPLAFTAQSRYRSTGTQAGDAVPLDGRVFLGGPVAFRMTPARYPEMAKYLTSDRGHHQYHEVHLSLSFKGPDQVPHLRRVVLAVSLSGPVGAQEPIAWSMAPDRIDSPAGQELSFEVRPQVKVAGIEISAGGLKGKANFAGDSYLIALGELSSHPSWELKRTSKPLDGRQRLILVVRSEVNADVTADVEITAWVRTQVLRRYRAIPPALKLTARL